MVFVMPRAKLINMVRFFIDELNDPSNEQLVAAREFAAIKAKRGTPPTKGVQPLTQI